MLELKPPAADAQRRVAWTVIAHSSFDAEQFAAPRRRTPRRSKLTPEKDAARADLVERQAAAIYKQAERARAGGKQQEAAAQLRARRRRWRRGSAVRANAQYDAAAALIAIKDWDGAIKTLEDFRQRFPNHALQPRWARSSPSPTSRRGSGRSAAGEYERLAVAQQGSEGRARHALAGRRAVREGGTPSRRRRKAYERYLALNPPSLESAVEARWRIAQIAKDRATRRARQR